MPQKTKKRMTAKFAEGGSVPSKARMAWDSVVENTRSLPRRAITAVGNAVTPDRPIAALKKHEQDIGKELADADEVQTKRTGGKIKARGIGRALRGHGRAG